MLSPSHLTGTFFPPTGTKTETESNLPQTTELIVIRGGTCAHARAHTCTRVCTHTQTKSGQCWPSFSLPCNKNPAWPRRTAFHLPNHIPQTLSAHVCPHPSSLTVTESKLCILHDMNPPRGWPCPSCLCSLLWENRSPSATPRICAEQSEVRRHVPTGCGAGPTHFPGQPHCG